MSDSIQEPAPRDLIARRVALAIGQTESVDVSVSYYDDSGEALIEG